MYPHWPLHHGTQAIRPHTIPRRRPYRSGCADGGYDMDSKMTDKTATELYERDARFRMQVTSAVARAIEECRQYMDEDNLRMRDVHEVATRAAVQALKDAFDGDVEIAHLRIERGHYKKLADELVHMRPSPLIISK